MNCSAVLRTVNGWTVAKGLPEERPCKYKKARDSMNGLGKEISIQRMESEERIIGAVESQRNEPCSAHKIG